MSKKRISEFNDDDTQKSKKNKITSKYKLENMNMNKDKDKSDSEYNSESNSETESEMDTETQSSSDYEDEEETLKKIDPDAYNNLILVKNEILQTEPTLLKILKEPLLIKDKAHLFQIYEIYKSSMPNTDEWFELRDRVITLFTQAKIQFSQHAKYTTEQHIQMENELVTFKNTDTVLSIKYKILNLPTSKENKDVIYRRYQEFLETSSQSDEYGKLKNWLNWATNMPYDSLKLFPYNANNLRPFLQNVSRILDEELFGMTKVKEQILVFLNAKLLNPHMKRCNLGFLGPPGVGKTAISRLLAKILDYPFEQISFGGISNTEFLKGHDYTYIGSQPGEIVKCLKRMGSKNGILFLDEYDKISDNKNICSALLHITDPTQNSEYRDNFLSEITIDLSYLWFIFSMNKLPSDSALRDRIFYIEISGYNIEDKIKIVEHYLLKKALVNFNIFPTAIKFDKNAAAYLIERVCSRYDKGVRTIEKHIDELINKINFLVCNQDENGLLSGFNNISFNTKHKLSYPLLITNDLINTFIDSKEIDQYLNTMYL
uniref:AAA+ ATPase domain-containing protein n=1 Tax=viral metagenome TaxID=1070528 RepID=A0A6C0D0Y9_9ZZZZ